MKLFKYMVLMIVMQGMGNAGTMVFEIAKSPYEKGLQLFGHCVKAGKIESSNELSATELIDICQEELVGLENAIHAQVGGNESEEMVQVVKEALKEALEISLEGRKD